MKKIKLLLSFLILFLFSCNSSDETISSVTENIHKVDNNKSIFKLNIDAFFKNEGSSISKASFKKLSIQLPNGEIVVLKRSKIVERKNGFSWFGTVEGYPNSSFILSVANGVAFGRLRIGKQIYKIKPFSIEKGLYEIDDLTNVKVLPPDKEPVPKKKDFFLSNNPIYKTQTYEDGRKIDLLVLYTDKFEKKYGSGVEAKVRNLVDTANSAFERSGIKTKLNIVGILKYDTYETNESTANEGLALDKLSSNPDVKNLREKYKADLVTLLRVLQDDGDNVCGIAYVLSNMPNDPQSRLQDLLIYKDSGYSVVNIGEISKGNFIYYCPETTLAHEIGHNLGCNHDRDHAGNIKGAYSYSYGYDVENVFATIMSYDRPLIEYFSTPDITYKGYPIGKPEGDPEAANNVKTINKTKIIVANYYNNKTGQNSYPEISVSSDSINFGKVEVQDVKTETIYVTNTGDTNLSIKSISLSGPEDFYQKNSCINRSLSPGESCSIDIYFSPLSKGVKNAILTIYSNARNKPNYQIYISGEGIQKNFPKAVINDDRIDFGKIPLGSQKISSIKIENISPDSNLSISVDYRYSPDFYVENNCIGNIGYNQRCSVDVIFIPKSVGKKSFIFYIKTNDPDKPRIKVSVYGEAFSPTKVIPDNLDFGKMFIGDTEEKFLTIKNIGNESFYINSIYTEKNIFSIEQNCFFLAPNETCKIKVIFKPKREGTFSDKIYIETSVETKEVLLKAIGVKKPEPQIYIPQEEIDFGKVILNKQVIKKFLIKNIGTDVLRIITSIEGKNFFIKKACETVNPNNSCEFEIIFSPQNVGTITSELNLVTNDPDNRSISIKLVGIALPPPKPEIKISPNEIIADGILEGNSVQKVLTIENKGKADLKIFDIKGENEFIEIKNENCKIVAPNNKCEVVIKIKGTRKGKYNFLIAIESNDPDTPEITVPLKVSILEKPKPKVKFPQTVNFGTTYVNQSVDFGFIVNNTGNEVFIINTVVLTDTENFSIRKMCQVIQPDSSCRFVLSFKPKKEGTIKSSLILETNIGTIKINLEGTALNIKGDYLKISPVYIDFGQVLNSDTKKEKLLLKNTSKSAIRIGFSLTNESVFYLKNNCPEVLNPEEQCFITIGFKPDKSKNYIEYLNVNVVDDFGTFTKKIKLVGKGIYVNKEKVDIDKDGVITEKDIKQAEELVLEGDKRLDINKDGVADISDLILLLRIKKKGE